MDAVKFIKEKYRMCNYYGSQCCNCPIGKIRGEYYCYIWIAENPEKAVELMGQWLQEHPQKTMMQDFFEKHPNAPKRRDGAPTPCPDQCGYEKQRYCVEVNRDVKECSQCWNRPME